MPRLNPTPPRQDCPTDSSPAARGSGGRFRRLAAALFVFAMLGTALPAAAQTVITLISNSGQTSGFSVTGSIQSQPFTTGDHPGGYTVTSVEIKIEDLRANARDVKIVPNANNGEPDLSDVNTVISLSSPSSYSANSLNTFTAPANTTLTANTTYHVLVDEAGIVAHKIEQTSSSAEDSGGASGWSIGNTRYWKNTPSESWTTDTTKIVKMKVNGYTISTSNNAPTVANAIPDQRAVAGTAFSYEFPAGTFNDIDSDALTRILHEQCEVEPFSVWSDKPRLQGLHGVHDRLFRYDWADFGRTSPNPRCLSTCRGSTRRGSGGVQANGHHTEQLLMRTGTA